VLRCALVVGGGSGLGMVVVTSAARDPLTKTWVNANPSNASARASTNRNPAATRTIDPFRIGYPQPQDVPGDSSTDLWFVHLVCSLPEHRRFHGQTTGPDVRTAEGQLVGHAAGRSRAQPLA
jgi:hypothetical protein